jgi:hypothetical protein
MLHNPPHRRAFVAWVRNRHVVAVDYDAMEAEVGRLEAQLTELARLMTPATTTEDRGNGDRY